MSSDESIGHVRRLRAIVDSFDAIEEIVEDIGALKIAEPFAIGLSPRDFVHPSEVEQYQLARDWALAHKDRPITIKLRFRRIEDWWQPLLTTFVHRQDRTELCLELDEAVAARTAAQQMRQLVERSKQGIIVRTLEKNLYINDGFARLLGYPRAADLANDPESSKSIELIHPDDRVMVAKRLMARLSGREAVSQYEFRLMRKDGTYIWVEVMAAQTLWDGESASLSWMIDITERKNVEAELLRSRAEAERANNAKSSFLASVSHELRTPLNAILGFSEMISMATLGPILPKYVEYASDIHRSGEHLLELINDILDMSKLEAGKRELREKQVDVAALMRDCVRFIRHRAAEDGLSIVEAIAPGLPSVHADERALKQVLLNFLSNAVKFTPKGGTLTVTAASTPTLGLEMSVSDTGIGMSDEDIKIAMQPFGQVDSLIARA